MTNQNQNRYNPPKGKKCFNSSSQENEFRFITREEQAAQHERLEQLVKASKIKLRIIPADAEEGEIE
jgi:hypothetical protein